MGRLAIIAGTGALPGLLAARPPGADRASFAGVDCAVTGAGVIAARLEHLGRLFADLRAASVTDLCLAGAMRRGQLRHRAARP